MSQVSQIVPTGTNTPPDRYAYGYQNVNNNENGEQVPSLHTLTVPSPAGPAPATASLTVGEAGTSTATINYDPQTALVASVVDGNGNTHTYTAVASLMGSLPPATRPERRVLWHNAHLWRPDFEARQNPAARAYDNSTNPNIHSNDTKVTVTDPQGHVVFAYVASFDNNMSATVETDGAGTAVSSSIYSDPNDPYRPSSVTDGNGHATSYTWDQYGNMLTETSPRGTVTTNTYNYANFALGELTSTQEGTKTATSYTYFEPSGLTQSVSTPAPGTVGGGTVTTSYTYDGLGNMLTVTAPGNNAVSSITTTFNYTTDGGYSQNAAIDQPLTVTDNLGKVTHYRYDAQGNQLSETDALGNETDHTYNIADQMLSMVYPATGQQGSGHSSEVNTYLYPDGPSLSETNYDESGTKVAQISYTYGKEGETASVTGSTEPVSYAYDALYRLSSLTNGNGHATSYTYNTAGYLYQIVYPGATNTTPGSSDTITVPSYDADGKVLQRIDGRNITTNYVYNDPESKLTDTEYPASTGLNVHFGYDSYGRRNSMSDGTGSVSYDYDDLDHQPSITTIYTGISAKTVSYGFYPDGSRATMNTPAGAFSYQYDGDERLTSLTNPFSETSSWMYLDNNWLKTQTLGNGAITTYTRDALGEITDLLTKTSGGTILSEFSVPSSNGFDGVGNLKTVSASIPGAPASYSGTTNYTYDSIPGVGTRKQLTQEASSRGGNYTNNFIYDGASYTASTGAGNPTTFCSAGTNSFNSDNQVTSFYGSGGASLGSFAYDGNGNPTTYKGQALTFDPENRMTSYGTAETCTYNGDNLRAEKAFSGGSAYYLYDDGQPVVELDGSGNTTAVQTFGANGLLSRRSGGSTAFYTFDLSGNTAQQLNSIGGVLNTSLVDSYGSAVNTASSQDPFMGFGAQSGYYFDAQTGLDLLGHRYYDPQTGRFLMRDPFGSAGGINLYEYAENNPINEIDPFGLSPTAPYPNPPGQGVKSSFPGDYGFHCGTNNYGPHMKVEDCIDKACENHDNCLNKPSCWGKTPNLLTVIARIACDNALCRSAIGCAVTGCRTVPCHQEAEWVILWFCPPPAGLGIGSGPIGPGGPTRGIKHGPTF